MDQDNSTTTSAGQQSAWAQTASTRSRSTMVSPKEVIRRLALAGLGAAAIANELANEVFSELVRRGEHTADEMQQQWEERRKRTVERTTTARHAVRAKMDAVLNYIDLPSKSDVDAINAKLNILMRRVNEIQVERVMGARTPPPEPTKEPDESS
jgi:polyhydroxyalkanoate synthesis regulator phasin